MTITAKTTTTTAGDSTTILIKWTFSANCLPKKFIYAMENDYVMSFGRNRSVQFLFSYRCVYIWKWVSMEKNIFFRARSWRKFECKWVWGEETWKICGHDYTQIGWWSRGEVRIGGTVNFWWIHSYRDGNGGVLFCSVFIRTYYHKHFIRMYSVFRLVCSKIPQLFFAFFLLL